MPPCELEQLGPSNACTPCFCRVSCTKVCFTSVDWRFCQSLQRRRVEEPEVDRVSVSTCRCLSAFAKKVPVGDTSNKDAKSKDATTPCNLAVERCFARARPWLCTTWYEVCCRIGSTVTSASKSCSRTDLGQVYNTILT